MKLILNEEELYLKETAKNFAENSAPVNHFRSLRDNDDPQLWSDDIWKEMVALGWSSILIPEEYGGSDFGLTGICVILQECGKTLAPSPLFATGVLGAYALTHFGNDNTEYYLFVFVLVKLFFVYLRNLEHYIIFKF
jgi:alkylation response protein AidB-like acyl-CoA dehydrogenase